MEKRNLLFKKGIYKFNDDVICHYRGPPTLFKYKNLYSIFFTLKPQCWDHLNF